MIQLDWYVPDTVLCAKLSGIIHDDELLEGDPALVRLLDSAQPDTVHLLLDFSELESLPSITTLVKLRWAKHGKLGKVIVIGSREPFTLTTSLVGQLFRKDLIFVDHRVEVQVHLDVSSQQQIGALV